MSRKDLRNVRAAAVNLERAQRSLYESVIAARESGETLGDIAAMAGLSREGVRQILMREGGRDEQ